MILLHVEPLAHVAHPLKPIPPHWPNLAVLQPAGVVAAGALVVVTRVVVGWLGVVGEEPLLPPPEEEPHDQTAGPGTV